MFITLEFIAAYLSARTNSERGNSLVETGLLVALVAVTCIGAVTSLGRRGSSNFTSISNSI